MESSTPRSLWDQEYLDSGCTLLEYDEETNVDDLPWTYATNFACMVICVAAFVKLVYFPRVGREKSVIWLPLWFLLTGIGFGVAGVGHILVKTKSDLEKYPIETVSLRLFRIFSFSVAAFFCCCWDSRCWALLAAVVSAGRRYCGGSSSCPSLHCWFMHHLRTWHLVVSC